MLILHYKDVSLTVTAIQNHKPTSFMLTFPDDEQTKGCTSTRIHPPHNPVEVDQLIGSAN